MNQKEKERETRRRKKGRINEVKKELLNRRKNKNKYKHWEIV